MIFTLPPVGVEATTNNDQRLDYDLPSELQPFANDDQLFKWVCFDKTKRGNDIFIIRWSGSVTVYINPHYWSAYDADLSTYENFITAYQWFTDRPDPDYDSYLVELLESLGHTDAQAIIDSFNQRNIVEFKYYEA